ncbi:HlyC/CorC family transporter [Kistimonas asteriae]|uniref:HlyC/CorC family transporter n=1 Tax=Kistimonas asteriae TaxID=517724 RepID=UPI001BA8DB51|nr:HlyC/CorC family transporter [Kistimonas asteriae]
MNEAPLSLLLGALVVLLLLSAFFSSSETGMMALNRYRLRHKARSGNRAAKRTSELLDRTDRLIGVILIGNNFVNILASAIATIIAVRMWGDAGIAIATFTLTLVVLVFGEVTPKTLAALHPEKVAFPASLILKPLLKLFYPLVLVVNGISNVLLRCLGVDTSKGGTDQLSQEELRTVVHEAGGLIPGTRRGMLLGILDLEKVSVDDIMIPRNEVVGIDIEDAIDEILEQLRTAQHTRLPIYKGDINNIIGILHMRKVARLLSLDEVNRAALLNETRDAYFVPEGTPLHTQLFNFQKEKRRTAIVVDEYGDVMGLVTLEDILEEIVGEFTTDVASNNRDITPQPDGSFIIDGTATIRDINKALEWHLPVDGPKTLNGLVTEHLEEIPDTSVCITISGRYRMEILQIRDNRVRSVRVYPPIASS